MLQEHLNQTHLGAEKRPLLFWKLTYRSRVPVGVEQWRIPKDGDTLGGYQGGVEGGIHKHVQHKGHKKRGRGSRSGGEHCSCISSASKTKVSREGGRPPCPGPLKVPAEWTMVNTEQSQPNPAWGGERAWNMVTWAAERRPFLVRVGNLMWGGTGRRAEELCAPSPAWW